MNFDKDPQHARKIAKEQKKLRQLAKRGRLEGKDKAKCSWDVELDNYDEPVKVSPRRREEDDYADYA